MNRVQRNRLSWAGELGNQTKALGAVLKGSSDMILRWQAFSEWLDTDEQAATGSCSATPFSTLSIWRLPVGRVSGDFNY